MGRNGKDREAEGVRQPLVGVLAIIGAHPRIAHGANQGVKPRKTERLVTGPQGRGERRHDPGPARREAAIEAEG